MKVAVLKFPGTNCDEDVLHVLRNVLKVDANIVWHEHFKADSFDAAILPGGFSYGDYLRAGAIAAHSPSVKQLELMDDDCKPILGICNGFQILVEAGLLPGALLLNSTLTFICKWVYLRVEKTDTAFTNLFKTGQVVKMPIAHKEGRFFADERTLKRISERIVLRYCDENGRVTEEYNPNGSTENIAGICDKDGNIVGLMPHPERASEKILSGNFPDGLLMFKSMLKWMRENE